MNRIEHPSFPNTLAGVIYQPGAFSCLYDGGINHTVAESAYRAARDAINGWDPTGGAIYYYNPAKTQQSMDAFRPVLTIIGEHRFCAYFSILKELSLIIGRVLLIERKIGISVYLCLKLTN